MSNIGTITKEGPYIRIDATEEGSEQVITLRLTDAEFDIQSARQPAETPKDDKVSIDRISKLHPKVRAEVLALYRKANQALTGRAQVRIVQGYRTMAEQAALYAQGRTTPGKIVTNAPSGKSYHEYGLAIDFALLIDGKDISWSTNVDLDGDKVADWMEVVAFFKAAGWKWGGDFKSIKDRPHFEKSFGYSVANLLAAFKAGKVKDGYVII